jgi:hypothetical protein
VVEDVRGAVLESFADLRHIVPLHSTQFGRLILPQLLQKLFLAFINTVGIVGQTPAVRRLDVADDFEASEFLVVGLFQDDIFVKDGFSLLEGLLGVLNLLLEFCEGIADIIVATWFLPLLSFCLLVYYGFGINIEAMSGVCGRDALSIDRQGVLIEGRIAIVDVGAVCERSFSLFLIGATSSVAKPVSLIAHEDFFVNILLWKMFVKMSIVI